MRSNLTQELLTRYKNIGDDPGREQIVEIIILMEHYLADLEVQLERLDASDPDPEAEARLSKVKIDLDLLRDAVGVELPRAH